MGAINLQGKCLASRLPPSASRDGLTTGGGGRLADTGDIVDCTAQSGRPPRESNLEPAFSESGANEAYKNNITM